MTEQILIKRGFKSGISEGKLVAQHETVTAKYKAPRFTFIAYVEQESGMDQHWHIIIAPDKVIAAWKALLLEDEEFIQHWPDDLPKKFDSIESVFKDEGIEVDRFFLSDTYVVTIITVHFWFQREHDAICDDCEDRRSEPIRNEGWD